MKGLPGGYFAFSVTTILFSSLPDCALACVPSCGTRDVHIHGYFMISALGRMLPLHVPSLL